MAVAEVDDTGQSKTIKAQCWAVLDRLQSLRGCRGLLPDLNDTVPTAHVLNPARTERPYSKAHVSAQLCTMTSEPAQQTQECDDRQCAAVVGLHLLQLSYPGHWVCCLRDVMV